MKGEKEMEQEKKAGLGGEHYTPYEERKGNESIVYFTRDLSAEGLIRLYEKINENLTGKVAVKLHTGEQHGPNIIPRPWVKELMEKEIPNAAIVETNTYYDGDRYTTEKHRKTLEVNGWTFAPVDIMDEEGTTMLPVKGGKWFTEMSVGSHETQYDSMLVLTHFKGHTMGGFGGSNKNIGMNFSEYVAVLSGNTDLLDKARLEKKIATLESERQAFVRGKSSSRYKLEQITEKIEKNNDLIRRIGKDLEHFKARVEFNEDGSYRNPVKLNGLETSDPKLIGKQLNRIAETARTLDRLEPIGSLYGFELLVQSETTGKDGLDLVQNRFYVRGEGDYLYQYNYGNIASDPRLAAMNFIHALATIEPTLEKFRKKNEELEKDIPVLREVVESSWRKEPELTALKTDLTEIDRRIQQSLKPIEESEGKEAEEDNDVCRERHDTAEELPKEDNTAARIPSRLRQIADASGGRIVIAGVGSPPENGPAKKGIKM